MLRLCSRVGCSRVEMFALDANTPNTAAPALIGAETGDFLPGFCKGYTRKSYPGITAFLMFAGDAVKNRLEVFAPLPGRIEEGTNRRRCIGAAALVLPSIGPVGAVTPGGARVLPDSLTGNRNRKVRKSYGGGN